MPVAEQRAHPGVGDRLAAAQGADGCVEQRLDLPHHTAGCSQAAWRDLVRAVEQGLDLLGVLDGAMWLSRIRSCRQLEIATLSIEKGE